MLKKVFLFLVLGGIVSSCVKDLPESDITILNREQGKLMEEYFKSNGVNARKFEFYDQRYGDWYPVYATFDTRGDTVFTGNVLDAYLVSYAISTLDNRPVLSEDSAMIYPGTDAYSKKIQGIQVTTSIHGIGGNATFLIPSSLGYGTTPPSGVENNAILKITSRLHSRLNESQQIAYFISKNKFVADQVTSTGLAIKKTHTTTDSLVTKANVTVRYTGKYTNGSIFDQNVSTAGATFAVAGVVPGFSEALKLMRVGEKATAILPSAIGYGANGNASIPPNMPLVFDIEIISQQ